MIKTIFISLSLVVFLSSDVSAGWSGYSNPRKGDSVVAPIQIKDKGIYNLVVSIHFLKKPYDRKPYTSDEYGEFINRMAVEWSGVAIQQILTAKEQNVNDLTSLKASIEEKIRVLAEKMKAKYSLKANSEFVFSLSDFFLLEPNNK